MTHLLSWTKDFSMKKVTLFTAGTVLAASLSLLGITVANAATTTQAVRSNPLTGLVSAIATKFNLNTADVQAVFDAQRAASEQQMQVQMAARQKTRLDADVTSGKITAAQESLIIAKQAEIQAFMGTLKAMTPTDRAAALKTEQASVQAWVTSNNIPKGYIMLGLGGMGGPGGFGGKMSGGMRGGHAGFGGRGPGGKGDWKTPAVTK